MPASPPLARIPPDPEPPIEGLTAKQSAFVRAYVMAGSRDATAAAKAAGYAPDNAGKTAWLLLRNDAVLAAIHSLTLKALASAAPIAVRRMVELMEHKSGHVAQAAAADIMDRLGMRPAERHHHVVDGQVTIDIRLKD